MTILNGISRRDQYLALLSLLLIVTGVCICLGEMILRGEEPRRAIVTLEMIYNHDYLKPTLHGVPYYNKPPLFNWILVGVHSLFGHLDNWALRTPSIIAYFLTGAGIFEVCKRYINTRVAVLASLFYLTNPTLLFFGTVLSGELDLLYSLVVATQIIIIFIFHEKKKLLPLFVFSYMFMAFGLMLKGAPSILFQGLTLLIVFFNSSTWKSLFSWQHFTGLVTGGTILFLYFFSYSNDGGDGMTYFLNLFQEASKKSILEAKGWEFFTHFLSFPFAQLIEFLPWSLLLLFAVRNKKRAPFRQNKLVWFSVLFIAINILPYWLSPGTKTRYHYMFIPYGMIVLAYLYDQFSNIPLRYALWLIFTLAVGRLAYSLFIIPYQVENLNTEIKYLEIADDLLQKTEGKELRFGGIPDTILLNNPVALLTGQSKEVYIPPEIPYSVALKLMRNKGQPFVYDFPFQKGVFYLCEKEDILKMNPEIIKEYPGWFGQEVVLCKFH
ncbi:MAG: hypothetical protein HKN16_06810 [Saprospiraceae bacterium]|nr:hypothetical protein [Saprospiraceae bacterium]